MRFIYFYSFWIVDGVGWFVGMLGIGILEGLGYYF